MSSLSRQNSEASTRSAEKEKKGKNVEEEEQATFRDTLSFVFDCGTPTRIIFFLGCIAGVGNGLVYPILAYVFSTSFTSVAGSVDGLGSIRKLAYTFMIVGVYGLVVGFFQWWLFDIVGHRASLSFRLQWFRALLRQDTAFYDVYDIGGLASTIGPNSITYRRGIGHKFGEGIQFFTTGVGGIGYAFYSSWRTAFVVLCVLPFASLAAMSVVRLNQSKGVRSAEAYKTAGSVAYTTVAAIKTVLSLNAIPKMIERYSEATSEAYKKSISILCYQGLANGCMLGSFMLLYCVLTLFGAFLVYRDISTTGCDPSGSVNGVATCSDSGAGVFGAMLGVAFAAQGVSQVGTFFETLTAARVAAYPALQAIQRKPGAPKQVLYKKGESNAKEKVPKGELAEEDVEDGKEVRAVLPEYLIDSTSDQGLKPENFSGAISFKNVSFSYPTRPNKPVLQDFTLNILAGKTVALVGPSGGGKSTLAAMIERFYDPLSGSIEIDGVDMKDINIKCLRSQIGYVGQEPTLFATTIAGNIKYGNPNATQEMIEAAARLANAHDFISSFPDGYNTQVGDKGAQLSGGQKQRIAISRVLIGKPSILLLDEATSALDSESELVVQEALDNVVAEQKRTTIIIAHRLSTIRNADTIVVVVDGQVVEQGTHDELMASDDGHYKRLVEKQERGANSLNSSRESSSLDLTKLDSTVAVTNNGKVSGTPHFAFKDVVFAYPTRPQKKIFKSFNLTVAQGETVALVGPSGGGKSTTVALIERFYDPLEGIVEYLGFDVKSLNLKWYRDQIGYVGQEPTLFNETIANNIAYGAPGATIDEIMEAAMQANAHDFIMSFPEGYDTPVGERGTQLSGGQKQRIAIARALVKKPKVMLLDEATSALDNESEALVQAALDNLMASRERTTIVIAHRLSTIRNADRIAFVEDGVVKEFGTDEELLSRPHGRYRRLVDAQRRGTTLLSIAEKEKGKSAKEAEDEVTGFDWKAEAEEAEKNAFSLARARKMASSDAPFMAVGSIGALMAGGVYPMWGLTFGHTLGILFQRVQPCSAGNVPVYPVNPYGDTCDQYWRGTTHYIRRTSYKLAAYWLVVGFGAIVGNMLTYWGFGMASERLNMRVRNSAFVALVRQEVSYFDKRSVGSITSQLQDDAARIHTFSGEPVRSFLIAVAAVITGVVLAFAFMWPFALLALAGIPFMGFAASLRMKQMMGQDLGTGQDQDGLNSPGGIAVETLLNIRTVSALTLEDRRFQDYEHALHHTEPNPVQEGICAGLNGGASVFMQQFVNALQFWWGGYILYNYPDKFGFEDFLVANFSLLFALFGLGSAFQGVSDRKETEASAGRIFYLLDRKSEIDPLSEDGKKLD